MLWFEKVDICIGFEKKDYFSLKVPFRQLCEPYFVLTWIDILSFLYKNILCEDWLELAIFKRHIIILFFLP